MRCPKCNQPFFNPLAPCKVCQFTGRLDILEELSHLRWLMNETAVWQAIDKRFKESLHKTYTSRQANAEIQLGLRLPPLTPKEAHKARIEAEQLQYLLDRLNDWLEAGYLVEAPAQIIISEVRQKYTALTDRLNEQPDNSHLAYTDQFNLSCIQLAIDTTQRLKDLDAFISPKNLEPVLTPLIREQEQLEIRLGLRPVLPPEITEPVSKPEDAPQFVASQAVTENAADPLISELPQFLEPVVPRIPLREKLWQMLLSERTLQGLLFIGMFLLFSAAVSFVAWGWKDFSAPLRVAIPTGFTAFCFAVGWYVRTKTPMYRSGIALSAIAALLVPVDSYTIYVNFYIPPEIWPSFWLATSLVSLAIYVVAAYLIRSQFFGYFVGFAAGSTVLALNQLGHQLFSLSLDWRTTGLSLLALGLISLSATFASSTQPKAYPRYRVFADPFRFLSLLIVGIVMPLTFGWRYLYRDGFDTFHIALIANWWIGSIVLGWGALSYRNRILGGLSAGAIPMALYLTQALFIERVDLSSAWHALGWAWLVPLYFLAGKKLASLADHDFFEQYGQIAIRGGTVLLVLAALWPLAALSHTTLPAAGTHAVLGGSLVLAAILWRRSNLLAGASIFSFTSATFAMTYLNLDLAHLSIGWATLAIVHIVLALNLGTWVPGISAATMLVRAGYVIAAMAVLTPIFPYHSGLLAYAFTNWIILTGWGARLAHGQQAGFVDVYRREKSIFHWLTALSLPMWLWIVLDNFYLPNATSPLMLALLAWFMIWLSRRLAQIDQHYRRPWYLIGMLVSIAAPVTAFITIPVGFAPALTLISSGLLYFSDAAISHRSKLLAAGGLVTAWGYLALLDQLFLPINALNFGLALLIGLYVVLGFWIERKRSPIYDSQFLRPLYLTSYVLTLLLLGWIYLPILFNQILLNLPWTTALGLWGAGSQILLTMVYGLRASHTRRESWAHVAIWLFTFGSSFIAITYSSGSGASVVSVAVLATILILIERRLVWLWRASTQPRSKRAIFRLTWRLYRRPLLIAGWVLSACTIGLALMRNLWWLGGGESQQIWAAAALLIITALYALSTRLFRRVLFSWLSAALIFVPWTILTHLGWLTSYQPKMAVYGLSWLILAWLLALIDLTLVARKINSYALPFRVVAHILAPFAILWALVDIEVSCLTLGLAVGFYTLAAVRDHKQSLSAMKNLALVWQTKFIYPALGLAPVWTVYLISWLLPAARLELYGLLLILFGPIGLGVARWLRYRSPSNQTAWAYTFPAYLVSYTTLSIGAILVAPEPALLALVLLFDTALMVVSARIFRQPVWLYVAAVLLPLSLCLALQENQWPTDRFGWWLIGLASIYLIWAWCLNRLKLQTYGRATLETGLILIMVGLAPSSLDRTGALWGYGGAAILYAISAFWLRQPPFLTLACGLALVPYAIIIQNSSLSSSYYGLALIPGAIFYLITGFWLDRQFGSINDFPWSKPAQWVKAGMVRILSWWALPLYGFGLGLAIVAPLFSLSQSGVAAVSFGLQMAIFGWAVYRFRLKIWLVAMTIAGHLAAFYGLATINWWQQSNIAQAWLGFLPVVLLTMLAAIAVDRSQSKQAESRIVSSWVQTLYIITLFDITLGQLISLNSTTPGVMVSLCNTLLLAVIASMWVSRPLVYASAMASLLAVGQGVFAWQDSIRALPVALAELALFYGLLGYGLTFVRDQMKRGQALSLRFTIWESSLQRCALGLSFGTLVLTGFMGMDLIVWTTGAILGLPFRDLVDTTMVRMVVGVFCFLGLLYVAAAFTHRWMRLGYGAIAMLLSAWMLHIFYIQRWDNFRYVQWYAFPAGLFLVSIAYFEWRKGNRDFARWLDYSAAVLMLGSLFWQTLLFGWIYALFLGTEGLAAFFWGSYRRLRRFLYIGMVGMILATVGQLLNSLQSVNQWIVFGIIGLLLVATAVIVERKLEDIKTWHEILETWE
ncbi:MAG: hypothetical protein H6631_02665 [Anaerolineaceae bacterium]|nr:hypothetical protein [Anaerolineaceae bacterium]